MGYIFDLDQTLVDSRIAEEYRKRREWKTVYSLISQFKLYEGLEEVFEILRKKGQKICVVTSSPESYCNAILKNFDLQVDYKVCYHDTKYHKPYPDPIFKALELMNENGNNVISIGDADNDIIASNKAGVTSCLALWGREDKSRSENADIVFENVEELKNYILKRKEE